MFAERNHYSGYFDAITTDIVERNAEILHLVVWKRKKNEKICAGPIYGLFVVSVFLGILETGLEKKKGNRRQRR